MSAPWLKEITVTADAVSEIHGSIIPAEVRSGEPIIAKINFSQDNFTHNEKLNVWRISPLGIELVLNEKIKDIKLGQKVDLEIQVGVSTSNFFGVVAVTKYTELNRNILGIRLCSTQKNEWEKDERRSLARWLCSHEFLPTGICLNPGKFNDFIYFKVTNLSASGMQIQTSMRNKYIVPGMQLDTTISLPMIGQIKAILQISNANTKMISSRETLSFGCSIINMDNQILELISQYVIQFGQESDLRELRDNGLLTTQALSGIEYKYVRTREEYESVLELRKLAYSSANKLTDESSISDIFDTRSRIIIGVYRGKVIASTRLIFNQTDDTMEHDQFVNFPSDFPRKDEICEITRVCTHPDFRGSDILLGLFKFVAITVVQSQRTYIMGCATRELLPVYKKLGFHATNMTYKHSSLNNIEHTIFIGNVLDGLSGKNVSPIYWNIVWADVIKYLSERGVAKLDQIARIRMGIYSLFKPISFYLRNLSRKPRKQKNKVTLKKISDRKWERH